MGLDLALQSPPQTASTKRKLDAVDTEPKAKSARHNILTDSIAIPVNGSPDEAEDASTELKKYGDRFATRSVDTQRPEETQENTATEHHPNVKQCTSPAVAVAVPDWEMELYDDEPEPAVPEVIVSWQCRLSGRFEPFGAQTNQAIERAHQAKAQTVEILVRGQRYRIEFATMVQRQLSNNKRVREIRRQLSESTRPVQAEQPIQPQVAHERQAVLSSAESAHAIHVVSQCLSRGQIVLILGNTGSGKTRLLNLLCSNGVVELPAAQQQWPEDRAIVSVIAEELNGDVQMTIDRLNAVGLNTVSSWRNPFKCLSNGQQERASLARGLTGHMGLDDFGSVVDTHTACMLAAGLGKLLRKRLQQVKLVITSTQPEICSWLQPDLLIDLSVAGSPQYTQRPTVGIQKPELSITYDEQTFFQGGADELQPARALEQLKAAGAKIQKKRQLQEDGSCVNFAANLQSKVQCNIIVDRAVVEACGALGVSKEDLFTRRCFEKRFEVPRELIENTLSWRVAAVVGKCIESSVMTVTAGVRAFGVQDPLDRESLLRSLK